MLSTRWTLGVWLLICVPMLCKVKSAYKWHKNVKSYTTEQQVLRWHWIAQQPVVERVYQLLEWVWPDENYEWWFQVCMAHGLPAPPLPHPLPPLWVWLCSTSIQCSHAALRCINHWTTDTELCNWLAPFTIVAVAAVQTGSRESLVTMPTTPATRLLSTQMGLLPFMHSWLCWLQ